MPAPYTLFYPNLTKVLFISAVIIMKNILIFHTLVSLVVLSLQADAGEFFVGLNAGTTKFRALNDACDDLLEDNILVGGFPLTCAVDDDSDKSLSINAGYNFNRFLGLELGYVDMGEYAASVTAAGLTVSATAEIDYTYASFVVSAPLTDKFSLSARVGAANADAEIGSQLGISDQVEDETAAFVGASADFRLNNHLSIQVRYETFDEVDITSAGIRLHF